MAASRVDLQTPSNTRYYVLDARGHARAMVDSTGSVTDYYEHDAWGNLLPGSFGSTPFKWNAAAGYQHVPFTGLYHVGAREYDPRTDRWLQRDPIGVGGGHPNVYLYCGDDPVNLSDPSGLWPLVGFRDWPTTVRLTPKSAFDHYLYGGGQPARVLVSDVLIGETFPHRLLSDRTNRVLSDRDSCGWEFWVDEWVNFKCDGDNGLVYGTVRAHLIGKIVVDVNGDWTLNCKAFVKDEPYDFNPSNHRGLVGEALTTMGRESGRALAWAGLAYPTPYQIYFLGYRWLSGSGNIASHFMARLSWSDRPR